MGQSIMLKLPVLGFFSCSDKLPDTGTVRVSVPFSDSRVPQSGQAVKGKI